MYVSIKSFHFFFLSGVLHTFIMADFLNVSDCRKSGPCSARCLHVRRALLRDIGMGGHRGVALSKADGFEINLFPHSAF
jgi:hypothetical protein